MSVPTRPRLSWLALASAVLGLFCVTGPAALFTGWLALRAVNGSDGRLRGAPLAVFGLVAGAVGTVALALGIVAIVFLNLREASNRAGCVYNLGQIGLAVNAYADNNGHTFPPAALPPTGRPPAERLSWLAGILTFLDERPDKTFRWRPLAGRLDPDRPWNDPANLPAAETNVPRFLCPSHPRYGSEPPGVTHYAGIGGLGADAASLPKGDPRDGFFGYDRLLTPGDLTRGTAYTLLAAETTADNGPWAAGGPSTVRGVDPGETLYIGPGRPFGGCHRVGGVDVLEAVYADGHVGTVKATVNPRVLRDEARISGEPLAD